MKLLLQPGGEIDGKYVRETLEKNLDETVRRIIASEELTGEEKEEAIADANYTFKRKFGDNFQELADAHREEIESNVKIFRVLEGLLLLADTVLMLVPTFLAYNGYIFSSQIVFVVLGVVGSLTVASTIEFKGEELTLYTQFMVVVIYLLTQIPYFVILLFGWLG